MRCCISPHTYSKLISFITFNFACKLAKKIHFNLHPLIIQLLIMYLFTYHILLCIADSHLTFFFCNCLFVIDIGITLLFLILVFGNFIERKHILLKYSNLNFILVYIFYFHRALNFYIVKHIYIFKTQLRLGRLVLFRK